MQNIEIKDHKDFPFIKAQNLETSLLNWKKIIDKRLDLGDVTINKLNFILKTYKGENRQNISIFTEKFSSKKENPSITKKLLLHSNKIILTNTSFFYYDENKKEEPVVFYKNINSTIKEFKVEGPNIYAKISKTSFFDNYNIKVKRLDTDFTYTQEQMVFKNTKLATTLSKLETDDMVFNFKRSDLSDFNNKVKVTATIKKAHIDFKDLHKFYDEFGLTDNINFTTKFHGTLNDFRLKNLKLTSSNESIINGDMHFINAINRGNGFSLNADFNELTSEYESLKSLLPNLLGKTLPSSFAMLGKFKLKGKSYITTTTVDAQLEILSDLGKTISNLKITNIDNIDKATYKGKIELIDFELGNIMKDDLVGKLSLIADIDGSGFTKETLNTSLIGHVTKHQYKGYTYSNIDINGVFKNQHFNGEMFSNDKNIKMNFKGLADLSDTNNYSFKFKANVAYADFNKLNLFKRDETSLIKGKIDIDLKGNSIDNIVGKINFKDASYTNQNDHYRFKTFDISSSFENDVRTLKVNSKDIINGKIKGNFKFAELPKLAKNSLGSIYTNYQKDSVSSGQFLSFNFKIYDKIIGVFFPEISLGKNTSIKGKIISDDDKFELTFKSPKVKAYDNIMEKIRLQIDNKNPLYNTLLSVKKINTKKYNLGEINLVNVTLNDTLFMRTDFIGGTNKELNEKYNLSLYHTINAQNRSVIGFKKSDIIYKNQKWIINSINDKENKVVFDNNFKNFDFKKLRLVSNDQELVFDGNIKDQFNKNLHLNFDNISLSKLPNTGNFKLDGLVNGKINYKEINKKIIPTINLNINSLIINKLPQGDLTINAKGDKTFKKYDFKAILIHEDKEKLKATGIVDLNSKNSNINANIDLANIDLRMLAPLGGKNITNIRGMVSGQAQLTGLLKNPDMKGNLYVDQAGLAFPYLNTFYKIKGLQKVTLNKQSFNLNQTTIIDESNLTEALLTGNISHTNFKKWFLNLKLDTDNLLVLNTQENEDTPYYGTGFMKGFGTIIGPTNEIVIDVVATTNPNTEFIVPLSDVNTVEENKLIRFITNTKKETDNGRPDEIIFNEKGLTLKVDLEVTPNALAQIVIDKATGSVLRGRGDAYLDIEINTNGKFIMNGTYIVDNGAYELKNIVNKTFKVKQGGKIYWSGSPFDAYLDIVAINNVKANPSVLLENIQGSRDIDVELITNITGNLYEPNMKFDINLPKASSLVQSELAYKINNEDKKMTQFFSLLGTGSFANLEDFDFGSAGSILNGTISEQISRVVTNLLRSEDDLVEIGVNLELGDSTNKLDNLRTDDQVDITFKTNIYKKIIVNGVVGVPIGSNTQSSIVGEIEVEMPLNKKENFRAKMYSRKNEVQFDILDSEGYTQGLGISYEINWDSASELFEKLNLKKTAEEKEKKRLKLNRKKAFRDSILKIKKTHKLIQLKR